MKKLFILMGALVPVFLATLPANAQHGPATYFDHARIYNPGGLGGPAISKSFACHFYYNSEEPNSMVIIDTSNHLYVTMMIMFTREIGSGLAHLGVIMGDFTGRHYWTTISRTPMPIDGVWHSVSLSATTSLHLIAASLDGQPNLLFEDLPGTTDDGPFDMPVNGNRWMIGSAMGPPPILPGVFWADESGPFAPGQFLGFPVAQYTGALDHMTCKFADDTYADILTPTRRNLGFTRMGVVDGGAVIVRPIELGSLCGGPWGDDTTGVVLCAEGEPDKFKANGGRSNNTAFTLIEGTLRPFLGEGVPGNSPWTQWWDVSP
jgi:hypothetical protein